MNISIKEYKTFVNSLNNEIIDILGDDYTSCWMFAYYIHCKYNLPIVNNEPLYEVELTTNFNLDKNGIYSYFMSHNTEIHHFVLFVNNDKIILRRSERVKKKIGATTIPKIIEKKKFCAMQHTE